MSDIKLEYAENFTVADKPVKCPHGQNPMGYGNKITTDRMVRFNDNPKRLYRVYVTCWSNCGTTYIIKGGKHLIIR